MLLVVDLVGVGEDLGCVRVDAQFLAQAAPDGVGIRLPGQHFFRRRDVAGAAAAIFQHLFLFDQDAAVIAADDHLHDAGQHAAQRIGLELRLAGGDLLPQIFQGFSLAGAPPLQGDSAGQERIAQGLQRRDRCCGASAWMSLNHRKRGKGHPASAGWGMPPVPFPTQHICAIVFPMRPANKGPGS